ncbi:MAG: PEGA domain-containing protein [Parabacteroides sp.]
MIKTAIHLIGMLWLFTAFPLMAQQMSVREFVREKRATLKANAVKPDKQQAVFDLRTNEKGFTFSISQQPVTAEEGEGWVRLKLPHKSTYLTIAHPDYGQITWKVPGKPLKKKHYYTADLFTQSPEKEYKPDKQWAVFHVNPQNAILYVDSGFYRTRDGKVQVYLPLGKHSYRAESPFYRSEEGEMELQEEERTEITIDLQPFYAMLLVYTAVPQSEIRLDGKLVGHTEAQVERLAPGRYHLTVARDHICYYNGMVSVGASQRKRVDLRETQFESYPYWDEAELALVPPSSKADDDDSELITPDLQSDLLDALEPDTARVHIEAFDDSTEIWINREKVAEGRWEESLAPGRYAVSTRKGDTESQTHIIEVGAEPEINLKTGAPSADYGMINLSSNVVDAEVYLNGVPVGYTPCILRQLPANSMQEIMLVKRGYKEAYKQVRMKGNDMLNIELKMKKR